MLTGTYYRAINGAEVKHSTAQKVEDTIYITKDRSNKLAEGIEDLKKYRNKGISQIFGW